MGNGDRGWRVGWWGEDLKRVLMISDLQPRHVQTAISLARRAGARWWTSSGQDTLYHLTMNISESELAALETVGQLLVI
jgi:hypothetical protein